MKKRKLIFIGCAVVFLTSVFVLQSSGRSASAIPPEVQAAMIGGSGAGCAGSYACVRDPDWDCKNYVDCSEGCPSGQVRCTDMQETWACNGDWFVPSCWPWAGRCWPGYVMTGECVGNVCVVQGDAGYCPSLYWSNCI